MKKLLKSLFALAIVATTAFSLTACGGPSRVKRSTFVNSLSQVRKSRGHKADLPSTGKQKVLVIPVQFSDYPCSSTKLAKYGGCTGLRDDIRKTMFGKSEETNWESLSSFYKKSSYGKLNITGKVTDWFTPKLSAHQYALQMEGNNTGISDRILDEAVEWYKSKYNDIDSFDQNKDGYIDSVYLIYTVPKRSQILPTSTGIDTTDLFWAYTYWSNSHNDINLDTDKDILPVASTYFWASVDFMYEDKMLKDGKYVECKDKNGDWLPDAHTFIHESGHIMGLPDYYTYGPQNGIPDYGALGGIDMMDNNVGDHNAYSKMIYGWTEPYVVSNETVKGDSTTLTIKPFYSSGDFILVNANWDGSMFSEYLLLEYYQPEGVNKYDAEHQFAGSYPQVFQKPGVKVYHVDSRLAGFDLVSGNVTVASSGIFVDFIDEVSNRFSYCDIANDNSITRSAIPEYKLIELLEPSGECSFKQQNDKGQYITPYATDASLFHEGDSFGYEGKAYADYKLHTGQNIITVDGVPTVDKNGYEGDELGFKFVIEKMDKNGVTIKFEKTASAY